MTGGSPPAAASRAAAASSCGVGGANLSTRIFHETRFTPASSVDGLMEAIALPAGSRIEILTSFKSGLALVQKSIIAPCGGFGPMNRSCDSKSRVRAMRHIVAGRTSNACKALSAVLAFICSRE